MNREPVYFPLFVNLAGKKCVVIGAGKIAIGKIDGLLMAGAAVTIVSPRATSFVQRLARTGAVAWRRRRFWAADLDNAFLAVAATNSARINAAVFRAGQLRGVLCNVVDDPRHCDFIYPAVVRRGSLQIAISTGGRSPALAARLRRELEQQFGPEWEKWVEQLGRSREVILRRKIPAAERKRLLLQSVAPKAFRSCARR